MSQSGRKLPLSSSILEALRSRYRVSRHHFTLFYKERIQETLAGCLYNEGQRKHKKPTVQQQPEVMQQRTTQSEEPAATGGFDE